MANSDSFSADNYQVARKEFFAYNREPAITFNNRQFYVNMTCLKLWPEVDYIQILINPADKKLALRPCRENDKDSLLWCHGEGTRRKPKHIAAHIFSAKIYFLLGWDMCCRYCVLGHMGGTGQENLLLFDLSASAMYPRITKNDRVNAQQPAYPSAWQNQFGPYVVEHSQQLPIKVFDDYFALDVDSLELHK